MLNRADTILRAERVIHEVSHRASTYGLGQGGFRPAMEWPWNGPARAVDCSGFYAWLLGIPRQHEVLEWIETSNIWRDAHRDEPRMFVQVPAAEAIHGDAWVWPDRGKNGPKRVQGHIALLWETSPEGIKQIVHASMWNVRNRGSAIALTPMSIYRAPDTAIFVRPKAWQESELVSHVEVDAYQGVP